MKQILLFFALIIAGSLNAKAQSALNLTNCDMQIQQLCINTTLSPSCTIASSSAYITIPANTTTPMTIPTCTTAGQATAYRVTYGSSTGCFPGASAIVYIPPPACTLGTADAFLPACEPCASATFNIHYSNGLLEITQ